MSEIKKRISVVQAKKAVRKANQDRQYGHGAIGRFVTHSSSLVDLFALMIEKDMVVAPGEGRGCRVQMQHIDATFLKIQTAFMNMLMERETNEHQQDVSSDDE